MKNIEFSNFEEFCKYFRIFEVLDIDLFKEAITHSSFCKKKNYERLEFLGDTLLNFCISKMLFEEFPNLQEGELSKKKSYLCSRKVCREISQKIKLDKEIIIAKKSNVKIELISADVLESFLAVIYYAYNLDKVYPIVKFLFYPYINSNQSIDPKMYLQEIIQKKYKVLPKYTLISKEGSDNEPIFKIGLSCGNLYVEAIGNSKKEAEKNAASKMLNLTNYKHQN